MVEYLLTNQEDLVKVEEEVKKVYPAIMGELTKNKSAILPLCRKLLRQACNRRWSSGAWEQMSTKPRTRPRCVGATPARGGPGPKPRTRSRCVGAIRANRVYSLCSSITMSCKRQTGRQRLTDQDLRRRAATAWGSITLRLSMKLEGKTKGSFFVLWGALLKKT